jgi:tetratricopeptide (TPR) repeat protein
MFSFASSIQVEKFENRGTFYLNAVEEQPEIAFTRGKLALYYAYIDMYDKAEEQLLYAIRIAPRDEYFENLGYIYMIKNKYAAAYEVFEKVLRKKAESSRFLQNLYAISSMSGNKKEALDLIGYFKETYPFILNDTRAEENIE